MKFDSNRQQNLGLKNVQFVGVNFGFDAISHSPVDTTNIVDSVPSSSTFLMFISCEQPSSMKESRLCN